MSSDGSGPSSSSDASTYARLGGGMATFGSATPVSKIVTEAMPVFVGAAFRVGLGAVVLAPFVLKDLGSVKKLGRAGWLYTLLIALFGMFGFSALMLYGMQMVSGVVGAIVMSTTPAVTAAASMLLMGDKPTWRKITAIVLAVTGVLILHVGRMAGGSTGGGSEADATGIAGVDSTIVGSLLVFGAVCCEAAYTLLGKKVSQRVDPVLVAFLAAALSVPFFIPLLIWQWSQFDMAAVDTRAWMALVWYGAGTLSLGTWLWYSGVKNAEGSVAAAFMGVMPCSALILSYVLLGEPFRWLHLAGFAVVLAGVLLVSWEHARMSKSR